MILDRINKLEAVLAGAVSANQPEVMVDYIDWNPAGQSTPPAQIRSALNSASDVTILDTPATKTQNQSREPIRISIYNKDTAAVTVTVKTDDGTTERIIIKATLQTLESLHWEKNSGWYAQDANGNRKTAVGPISSSSVLGTTTNNNAAAGYIGEYIESVVALTSFPTTGQWGDLASISLTPGDWDVSASFSATANGGTVSSVNIGVSTTSGNSGSGLVGGSNSNSAIGPTTLYDSSVSVVPYRVSISATTTYYLKYLSVFTVATPKAAGRLSARRVR